MPIPGVRMVEQASDPGSTGAGQGTVWPRDDAPNVLMFTDDAGTDHVLAYVASVTSAVAIRAMPSQENARTGTGTAFAYGAAGLMGADFTASGYGTPAVNVETDDGRATSYIHCDGDVSDTADTIEGIFYVRVPDGFSAWGANGVRLKTKMETYPGATTRVDFQMVVYDSDAALVGNATTTRAISSGDADYVWTEVTPNASKHQAGDAVVIAFNVQITGGTGDNWDFRLGQLEIDFA